MTTKLQTKPMTCWLTVVALSIITQGLARNAAGQGFDVVQTTKPPSLRGEITKTSPTELTISVSGLERIIPVNTIVKVTYMDAPSELTGARRDIDSGNVEAALEKLKRIKTETLDRDVVKQEFEFLHAMATARLALSGSGDKAVAVRDMLNFQKDHKNSFRYYEVVQVLGDLAVALSKYDRAIEFYRELGQSPWKDYQLNAIILEANALTTQKNYSEALTKYVAASQENISGLAADRLKVLAKIGQANCLAETGTPDEGIQITDEVLDKLDRDDFELHAKAYNARGACFRNSNKIKDALLAYLHTDLLYFRQSDAHAEALFYLSALWEQDAKRERAVKSRKLLQSRYAGSHWAQQL